MPDRSIRIRALVTVCVLVGAIILLKKVTHGERVSPHHPLRELPLLLGHWHGDELPLEQRVVAAAGVDDHLNRVYDDGTAGPIILYVGYYKSQRTGDTIHSPKNCLPGSGWEPAKSGRISVPMPDGSRILVNEYLVEKGLDRQLVLYWYQARGRVIASEYWGKVWMVVDALRRNRTDGALVRISTPVRDGNEKAQARATEFVQLLYPRLSEFIPN